MLILVGLAAAFDVDRVQLPASALTSAGTLLRPAPFLDGPGSFYLGGLATVAANPLRFATAAPGGEPVGAPVIDELFGVELAFGGVVASRVRLDAAMDFFPSVTFPQHEWSVELEPLALGDARIGGQVQLVAPRQSGLGLAVDAHARLATGDPLFTEAWGGQGRLILGGRHGRFGWSVDAGVDYADEPTFLGRQLGTAGVGGAGVHVWPVEEVAVGLEVDARHPLEPTGDVGADTSEWMAYVGYTPCTGAQLAVGGGGAVIPGVGTPEGRFILTFGYSQGDCSFARASRPMGAGPPPPPPPPPVVLAPRPPLPQAAAGSAAAELTPLAITIRDRVEFAYRSARLLPEADPVLAAVAEVLRAHPEVTSVEVAGHTDERGDDAFNLRLSQDRARAVVAWLVSAGVEPGRLTARGYGETLPLMTGHTEAAWSRNRRVEFRVIERKP